MENKYQWLICESRRLRSSDNVISVLNNMNRVLDSIIYQDDSYSYEAFRTLLIINHNFRSFLNSNYLNDKRDLSFLSHQIKNYYAYGGNQDIISYLADIDYYKNILLKVELQGKQQFVLRSFSLPFSGIPDDLKKLCECPDFIQKLHQRLFRKYIKKNRLRPIFLSLYLI